MTDILELIDNAIEGNTSVDAMRWTPDDHAPAPSPPAATIKVVSRRRHELLSRSWHHFCLKHYREYAEKREAEAAQRVRLRRMHSAYHARRR